MTPTIVEELDRRLLRAAVAPVLPGSPVHAAWGELCEELSGGLESLTGERQELLGLVHETAAGVSADGDLARQLLAGVRRRNWVADRAKMAAVEAAVAALSERRIPHLLVGDAGMAVMLGDSGIHPLRELRVAVGPADRPRAEDRLAEVGWRPRARASGEELADPGCASWISPAGEELRITPFGERWFRHDVSVGLMLSLLTDRGREPRGVALLPLADACLAGARLDESGWQELLRLARAEQLLTPAVARLWTLDQVIPGSVPPGVLTVLDRIRIGWQDRAAHRVEPVSTALAHHLRASAGSGRSLLLGLPESLQEAWALRSGRELPRAAAARLRARAVDPRRSGRNQRGLSRRQSEELT